MYELEFTPNQAKSYQVGFDLTTEPVGDYVANTDYLSIDTWDNNSYVSNVVLDGGLQLSGDVISGTVTITTTNSISSDFVLNITMRYNDVDNSINKTISQTIQMTNNLGGLDQVIWKFDVSGDIVATRDYGTGTETLNNVTITLFPKNQNEELPGIAVGKLDEIFDLAATTVYLDSKDQQTFQSVDIVSYNYKDSNDSFIFVLSPTIKLSNEGRNADHIELVFHTTYGSTTYNAEIPWSITINKSNIPGLVLSDMYYDIIEGVKDYNFSLDYSNTGTSFSNGSVNIDYETTNYELTQEKIEKYSTLELSDTSYGYFTIENHIGLASGVNKITISPLFNFSKDPGDYKILQLVYTYNDTENGILRQINKSIRLNGGKYIKLSNLTIDSPIYYTPNSNVDIRYYPNFSIDVDTNLDTLNLEKLKMVHVTHETITGEYKLGEGGSNLAFEYINEDSLEYDDQSKKITGTFNLVIWTIPANHCFENTYGIIYEDTDSSITSNEVSASWLLKDPALDSNYIIIPTEKKITQDQLSNIQNLDTSEYISTAYTGSFTNTYVLGEEPFIDTPDKIRIKIPENIEQYFNKTLIKNGYLGKHIIEIVDCSPSSGLSGLSDGEHNEIITKTNFIDCSIKKEDSDSGLPILHYVYSLNPSTTDTPHEISCVKTGNKIVITQKVWATDLMEVIEPEYSADYWVEFSDNQVYLDPSIVTTNELSKMNFSVTYQWLMVVQEG